MIYNFSPSPTFGISEHSFVTWENGFTNEELDRIIFYGDSQSKYKATVGSGDKTSVITEIRESTISWISYNNETSWFYDRMAWITRQLNGKFYKFDLHGFCEDMQYTVYSGENNEHYTWHIDAGTQSDFPPRKFSLVVQLNDPNDYEGGELQIFTSGEPISVLKQRGLVAAFPSYVLHRVTPVTSGVRKTLVVWSCGPAFK